MKLLIVPAIPCPASFVFVNPFAIRDALMSLVPLLQPRRLMRLLCVVLSLRVKLWFFVPFVVCLVVSLLAMAILTVCTGDCLPLSAILRRRVKRAVQIHFSRIWGCTLDFRSNICR